MNLSFPTFSPAFSTFAGGLVRRGPHRFDGAYGPSIGWYLNNVRTSLVPELFGPYTYADFHQAPSLIGYRVNISLDFSLVETDTDQSGNFGLALMQAYYLDAFVSDAAATGLRFNLYAANGSSPWRYVYPISSWAPAPTGGKQARGVEIKLDFYTRDILAATEVNSWESLSW